MHGSMLEIIAGLHSRRDADGGNSSEGREFCKLLKMREADFYDDKAAEESSMESSIEGESWLES